MSRAVIYARQSLDRSGEGLAVARQVKACRALAEARGWDVVATVDQDNDTSASTGRKRPGWTRVLDLIEAGAVDVVIAYQVDRIARTMPDIEHLVQLCERTGVRVATVSGDLDLTTDSGRMVARILGSVARHEVERKGRRQRDANRDRAEKGAMGWTRRPFGYDHDAAGNVVLVEHEAAALREAAKRVAAGVTMTQVCRDLTGQGVTTSLGKPFSVTTLRRLLLSPRNAGVVTYNGEAVAAGKWPAILDSELQQQLVLFLRDPGRPRPPGNALKYLVSGYARCGECGGVMYSQPISTARMRWVAYACKPGRGHVVRRVEHVDDVVTRVALARLGRPDAAALFLPQVDMGALREELRELRERRDALGRMLAEGLMSATAVQDGARTLTAKITQAEAHLASTAGTSPLAQVLAAPDVAATWNGLPVRERRDVVKALMTVTILPVGAGATFDPESVRIDWR